MGLLPKFEDKSYPELKELVFVLDEMEDWDYFFIKDMVERSWLSDKQYAIVQKLYYKYVKRYM